MTDQLNGAWGARLLYGEPVGPIPSELSHGSGVRGITCLHRRIRVARRTSVALSRHQGASAQDVLLKGSNRAQAALGTRRQHFHPERTCAGSIQGLAKLPRRHSHLPAEIHR